MWTALMTTWLALPIAPLNPIEQDTVASINLQSTVGIAVPNGIISAGPELAVKYELRMVHHLILRLSAEYRYGELTSRLFPRGSIHSGTFALEGLYYHGTNRLMGYVGFGGVYNLNGYTPWPATWQTLQANNVTDIWMSQAIGYRVVIGFRWRKQYALEISTTELYPKLRENIYISETRFARETRSVRTGSFRISLGYIIPLQD